MYAKIQSILGFGVNFHEKYNELCPITLCITEANADIFIFYNT